MPMALIHPPTNFSRMHKTQTVLKDMGALVTAQDWRACQDAGMMTPEFDSDEDTESESDARDADLLYQYPRSSSTLMFQKKTTTASTQGRFYKQQAVLRTSSPMLIPQTRAFEDRAGWDTNLWDNCSDDEDSACQSGCECGFTRSRPQSAAAVNSDMSGAPHLTSTDSSELIFDLEL